MRTDARNRSKALVPRSAWHKLLHARDIFRFLLNAMRRSAWRKLKNGIKFVLGRDPIFDEAGLFLRQYLLHVTGIQPIRKITCTGKSASSLITGGSESRVRNFSVRLQGRKKCT